MLALIFGIRHSVAWTNRHLSTILVLCRVLNALKILYAVHVSLSLPLTIIDIFIVSVVMPFSECRIVGIIQSVAFSD